MRIQVSGFRIQVSGFRIQVSGFRFQVSWMSCAIEQTGRVKKSDQVWGFRAGHLWRARRGKDDAIGRHVMLSAFLDEAKDSSLWVTIEPQDAIVYALENSHPRRPKVLCDPPEAAKVAEYEDRAVRQIVVGARGEVLG